MTIYIRYFRVTAGPLIDKAIEIEQSNAIARKEIAAFCKEIGADDAMGRKDGPLTGFKFSTTPDQGVWKQPDKFGAYWPRKNTAPGREMLARIKPIPEIRSMSSAVAEVGLANDIPVVFGGMRGYITTLFGAPSLGVVFVGVPWTDKDPQELDDYRAQRASGTRLCMELDHLLWKPTAEMVELKRWEVEKEIEELNRKIEVRNLITDAVKKAAQS